MKNSFINPEWLNYIKGHLHDDPFSLSLASKKERDPFLQEAINQIQSRQKGFKKLPAFSQNFDIVFPPPVSVEQASSEITAKYKSKLFSGNNCADLTGGMGIDTIHFSANFNRVVYADISQQLCEIAKYNFRRLGLDNISVLNISAEEFLKSNEEYFGLIFLDPSRRDTHNKKVFKIEDCVPNILELEDSLIDAAKNVLLKLSPLADLKQLFRQFKSLSKIWVISVKNECKEILCELNQAKEKSATILAVNIEEEDRVDTFSFDFKKEKSAVIQYELPSKYIYEPNSSILKSGAFTSVGLSYGLKKLHVHSHLYTSMEQVDFPGRVFKLLKVVRPDKKEIAREIRDKRVNVITRNFPLKPEEIIKKFNLKNGDDLYLIATTLIDNSKVMLLCQRIK